MSVFALECFCTSVIPLFHSQTSNMIEFTFTWPCGTIIYERVGLIDALLGRFQFDSRWGCPLHGKKCLEVMKKNERTKK